MGLVLEFISLFFFIMYYFYMYIFSFVSTLTIYLHGSQLHSILLLHDPHGIRTVTLFLWENRPNPASSWPPVAGWRHPGSWRTRAWWWGRDWDRGRRGRGWPGSPSSASGSCRPRQGAPGARWEVDPGGGNLTWRPGSEQKQQANEFWVWRENCWSCCC